MLKWLAKIFGLVKEEKKSSLTPEMVEKIAIEAAQRVANKSLQDSAAVQSVEEMIKEQRGFTTPSRPASPGTVKYNSRGVRVPTAEEAKRARPAVPPPPPPPPPFLRMPPRYEEYKRRTETPPKRGNSSSDDGLWGVTAAASWSGDSSSSSSSCDSGGGGSCD